MAGINAVFILAIAWSAALAQAPPKLPNIGYIGYGYNVFLGNPHASSHFDPGFGQVPIFTFTYNQQQTTADGKWLVPDNIVVPGSATECNVQGSATTIQYTATYQSSLSVDATFDLSGFGASFSASSDYKEVDQSTTDDSDVYVSTTASCQTYLVDINAYVHPNYSSVFELRGSTLPTEFDPNNASTFWEFFDLVGTHFPTQIVFGSRWGYSFQSTFDQWTSMQSVGLDVSVAASYAGLMKAGVTVNTSYAQQMAQNFTSQTTQTYEFGLGLPPPESGNTEAWLQQSLSSTLMDPIQYTLMNISQLFSSEFTTNAAMQARYSSVYDALSYYCKYHLIPTGVLSSCALPPPPPPPAPAVGYGALACGFTNGKTDCYHNWAVVFDGSSNIQAQEVVLDYCPSCTVIANFNSGNCLAMAISTKNDAWGVEWNIDNQTAVNEDAIKECESVSNGGTCEVVLSGCSVPPPSGVNWGAIACTGSCDSYSATKQGYPDRIEAHKIAMESLQGSFVAVDFDQCGAVAKSNTGYSSSSGDTPQDATDAAMATCQDSMQGCKPLTYACVNPTLSAKGAKNGSHRNPVPVVFTSNSNKKITLV